MLVSAASAWEVATKHRLGKRAEVPQAAPRFAELVAAHGFVPLAVEQRHALRAGASAEGGRFAGKPIAFEALRTRKLRSCTCT